jgi:predicted MFS family arabinose efflux permease
MPRDRSELAYRIRNSASAKMWITVAIAVVFALVTSTFFGAAFGYVGGFIIFMGVGARVLYVDLKRRRARPVRVKDKSAADEAHDFGAALFQDRLVEDRQRAADGESPLST